LPRLRKPRAIPADARIGIAAPGGPVDAQKLLAGVALWRERGFDVVHRDDLTARRGYLAGDDARRVGELRDLIRDPAVDAIVCARGGYGCDRILPALDPQEFRAARKPLVGFSDVTALLLWQRRRAGLTGFHGPMLEWGEEIDREAFGDLVDQLRGAAAPERRLSGRGCGGGRAEGRLSGGNLVLVTASLATPWEIDTRGAILLIEEVGEPPYRIDRMLRQLHAAGKLACLAGIGVGQLVGCDDARYPQPGALDVIEEMVRPLALPLVVDLPFGHVQHNRAWPVGARATIDADRGEVRILERGVVRTS
jgi:muramoyltetrapeptide carboxypeptidase